MVESTVDMLVKEERRPEANPAAVSIFSSPKYP
jgi:hypothetical protein